MVSTLVYCIRHGQTAENLQGIIQGQLDTSLDGVGVEQAAATGEAFKDVKFNIAFSSDLTRAVDTANAILSHHREVPLQKVALLRERFLGNLQGQAVHTNHPPADETIESSAAFRHRILQFWDEGVTPYLKKASERHSGRPVCILVVSHGAYIGTLARVLVAFRKFVKSPGVEISWCPNASVTLIEVQHDGTGLLRSYGDIAHLVKPVVAGNADELNDSNTLPVYSTNPKR